MFPKLISNLSFSPQVAGELTYYLKRLRGEQLTRRLSAVFGVAVIGLQLAAVFAAPEAINARSDNDVISGGFTTKEMLIQSIHKDPDVEALFSYFHVSDGAISRASAKKYIPAKNSDLLSIGRIRHDGADTAITPRNNGTTFFVRKLSSVAVTTNASVIEGTTDDQKYFAVLFTCGNLAVTSLPTTPPPPPPVTTKPIETPPPVVIPTTPNISPAKDAVFLNRKAPDGSPLVAINNDPAKNPVAEPGDEIEYHLKVSNTGDGDKKEFPLVEDVRDILEYADVTNLGGATMSGGILDWGKVNIPARTSVNRSFAITVKSPVSQTPVSASDRFSFDLQMDNVFGNKIAIKITPPPVKQVEQATAALPQTGAAENIFITLAALSLVVYFFARNRQLVREIQILRVDNS